MSFCPCQVGSIVECLLFRGSIIGAAGKGKVNRRHGLCICFRYCQRKQHYGVPNKNNKLTGPLKSMSK